MLWGFGHADFYMYYDTKGSQQLQSHRDYTMMRRGDVKSL
jgi:hypothetical protein